MKKVNQQWSIRILQEKIDDIEFPEYQREPTVWDIERKRKLIDSILRKFDIASIYLYKREDGNYDCIDGRQRINAIISYLGLNEGKDDDSDNRYHNNFKFISSDELLGIKSLEDFNNKTWDELDDNQQSRVLDYKFNVIEITEIDTDEELNLMFLRLQLGAHLNGGEKLKAMVGSMRDLIFKRFKNKPPLGEHPYFEYLQIPKRRYSKELTAAQIATNFFSLRKEKSYKRARFVDLQEFFKNYQKFSAQDNEIAELLYNRLELTYKTITENGELDLKNRAMGISTFFFIDKLVESEENGKIEPFISFLNLFLIRLKEQVEKGIDIEARYRDLLKFQTYISQAAVEKYAIENRQKFLEEYFKFYLEKGKIKGDK
jgi:hypothetical protein